MNHLLVRAKQSVEFHSVLGELLKLGDDLLLRVGLVISEDVLVSRDRDLQFLRFVVEHQEMAQFLLVGFLARTLHQVLNFEHPFGTLKRSVEVASRRNQVFWSDVLRKLKERVAVFWAPDD